MEIYWIPVQSNVPGNEIADIIAKEATGWREMGPPGVEAPRPLEW